MTKYQSPFKLPDEHMRLVGVTAAHWECLNLVLERIVAFVTMNEFRRVAVLTRNVPFGTKIDLILAYARPYQSSNPVLWKEFNDAIQQLRHANNIRNEYVHATWVVEKEGELPKRWKLSTKNGKLIDDYAEVKIDELEKAAQFIYDAGEAITKPMLKVGMKPFEFDD